jgi:hypothetical protein
MTENNPDLTAEALIKIVESGEEGLLDAQFIDGKVEYIRQPSESTMSEKEFKLLIKKIFEEKHRCKMKIKLAGKGKYKVWTERSFK